MTGTRRANNRLPSALEAAFDDPENCSIDSVVKVALSDDSEEYTWALAALRNMVEFGRDEAGVFLIGLLLTRGDNWKKRQAIVHTLYHVQTEHCVDVLFAELKGVKSTNVTRRYLRELVGILSDMPPKLVRARFHALAADTSLTHWVRSQIERALDSLDC